MSSKGYDKESREVWFNPDCDEPTLEQLKFGCLQRIANAVEDIAWNRSRIVIDRDRYRRLYESERNRSDKLAKRNVKLKDAVTKLKKRKDSKS